MNVLIIGASRGIGLELVRQYRATGAAVTATARDAAGLARLRDLGAQPVQVDVASAAGVSGLADAVVSTGGSNGGSAGQGIDINAGSLAELETLPGIGPSNIVSSCCVTTREV